MEERIIVAGFGGQGVLLMGQLVAYAGMIEGREVTWMPSYGPEVRGGAANCAVVVSDSPIGAPTVTEADTVIAMNRPSLELFEKVLVPGGTLIYNSSIIDVKPTREDIKIYAVPCNDMATKLNNPRVANMIPLGAYIALKGVVKPESLIEALRNSLGEKKESLIPINQAAIDAGMNAINA